MWVLKIILFICVFRFFIDAVVFCDDKQGPVEVIGSLLTFCDSPFLSLVIDVYTRCLMEDNCIKTLFMN